MDYLPIQASAVPCERAFSSGAETITARRNRIKPALMEALQMLKFALKKRCLNFTEDLITPEELMKENEDEEDPLTWFFEDRPTPIEDIVSFLTDDEED